MSAMNKPAGWGPSHQRTRNGASIGVLVIVLLVALPVHAVFYGPIVVAVLTVAWRLGRTLYARRRRERPLALGSGDPLEAVGGLASASAGVYLGAEEKGALDGLASGAHVSR